MKLKQNVKKNIPKKANQLNKIRLNSLIINLKISNKLFFYVILIFVLSFLSSCTNKLSRNYIGNYKSIYKNNKRSRNYSKPNPTNKVCLADKDYFSKNYFSKLPVFTNELRAKLTDLPLPDLQDSEIYILSNYEDCHYGLSFSWQKSITEAKAWFDVQLAQWGWDNLTELVSDTQACLIYIKPRRACTIYIENLDINNLESLNNLEDLVDSQKLNNLEDLQNKNYNQKNNIIVKIFIAPKKLNETEDYGLI